MTAYRHPEFLSDDDEPRQRVRCPIHGFIRYSENERKVIDHPLFQRLRRIRQLALTEYVYPGATHTRFEHSLGVMETATRMFDALLARHGEQLEAQFGEVAGFHERTLLLARQYLRLAALLHDVGHTCFSHAVEEQINRSAHGHEAVTQRVIREPDLLGKPLAGLYGAECPDWVARFLSGEDLPPQLLLITDLLSSQIDADRTDYLLRDSHHCGVDYGRFDHLRFIDSLTLASEDDVGGYRLAIRGDGVHTVEALILARYQMNTQVYFHRGRRLFDRYLGEYFRALGEDCPRELDAILDADDFGMLTRMRADASGQGDAAYWASRILRRQQHRLIHQTTDDADAMEARRSERIHRRLVEQYPDVNFLRDVKDSANHKFLVPGETSADKKVSLKVVNLGRIEEIGQFSRVLGRVPTVYQCARIFADVTRENRALLNELQTRARQLWGDAGG